MPWYIIIFPRQPSAESSSIMIRGPLFTAEEAREAARAEWETQEALRRPLGEERGIAVVEAGDRREAMQKFFRGPRPSSS
jgi:hypothetical protein